MSAVLLNWNGGELVVNCLRSVLAQTHPDRETIVVDNGSSDGSLEALRRVEPQLSIIANQANLGFAVAANQGIRAAAGDWVLLLNQDVRLEADYVARLIAAGERDARIGSVTGKLLRLRPVTGTSPPIIDGTGHILHRNGWTTNRGEDSPDEGQWEQPGEVFGVSAAAVLYRKAMLDEVTVGSARPFDERFFAYNEDVDLDWRARWLGWKAWYEPAVAWHVRNATGGNRVPFIMRHIVKNQLLLVANNDLWPNGLGRLPNQLAFVLYDAARLGAASPSAALGLVDALRQLRESAARRRFLRLNRRASEADLATWMVPFPYRRKATRRLAKLRRSADRLHH